MPSHDTGQAPLVHPAVLVATGLFLIGLALDADLYRTPGWNAGLALGILALLALHVYLLGGGRRALGVARALTVRGWHTFLSYKFQVLFVLVQLGLFIAMLLALSRPVITALFFPVGQAMSGYTSTNYVVFLLLGFSTWPVLWRSYQVSGSRIRQEQVTGMFESLVATPAGAESLPLAYLVSTLVGSAVSITGLLAAYAYLLPDGALRLHDPMALLSFLAIVALSVVIMWGIGLLVGGLTAVFKQAGSASSVLRFGLLFFAGIYVPIDLLPGWAGPVSRFLPLTYTFEAVRGILADGDALSDHLGAIGLLALFALLASAGGMWTFRRLLDRARRAGTLTGY